MRIGIDARELCGTPTGVGRHLAGILGAWQHSPAAQRHSFLLYAHQPPVVALPSNANEAQLEPGYDLATKRRVSILLSSGTRVAGTVSVCQPVGRDRLSDHAHLEQAFWYVETSDHTLIVNSAHIVELLEIAE